MDIWIGNQVDTLVNSLLRNSSTLQEHLQIATGADFEFLTTHFQNLSKSHLSRIVDDISSLTSDTPYSFEDNGSNKTELVETPDESLNQYILVIDGYSSIVIASVGIVANIFGICFVSIGKRRGTLFNLLLTALFTSDSIFLSQEILRCIDLFFLSIPETYLWTYHIIVNTTIRCSMTSSILFLIAIAHARLVAITKPFQNSSRGSSSNKSKLKFLGYGVPIIILSAIVASTVYLETGKEPFETENGETIFMPVPSAIRVSPIYSVFCVGLVNFGLLGVFPMSSLIYCSYHLIRASKKNNDSILSAYPPIVAIREKQRQNLTKSLVFMIFAFMALHSLRVFNSFGEIVLSIISNENKKGLKYGNDVPRLFYYTTSISELLMITYASINVMIYLYPNLSKAIKTHLPAKTPPSKVCSRRRNAIVPGTPMEISLEPLNMGRRPVTNRSIDYQHAISMDVLNALPLGRQERLI